MIVYILLVMSVILNGVFLYGVRNLLIQNEKLEDELSTLAEQYENHNRYILTLQRWLKDILNGIRMIDIGGAFKTMGADDGTEGLVEIDGLLQPLRPGAFEGSDEVSTTFEQIRQIIASLEGFLQSEENEEAKT